MWQNQRIKIARIALETLRANHLFSSQQVLVDHLYSKGVHNKMHKQQVWHVIDQDS
jgi:hypothetical protein